MPTKKTVQRARKKAREGKAPTTQAGEFVREEMEHAKRGRHSSGNPKQAIAIGLSKARRAGVNLKPPKKGRASAATRKKAERDYERGQGARKRTAKKPASSGRSATKRGAASTARKSASAGRGAAKKTGGRKTAARKTSARKKTAKRSR